MDLYEYQARELFAKHGVPVLGGQIATTPEQAEQVATELLNCGTDLLVVKAQVKTGGRGKAGGVKLARSAAEARQHAEAILGMEIKGHTVRTVLISEGADIDSEFYFSILLDRAERRYLAMCSREGGMEIETLAKERPRRWPAWPWTRSRALPLRSPRALRLRPALSPVPWPTPWRRSSAGCGRSSPLRTPHWWRSTPWS